MSSISANNQCERDCKSGFPKYLRVLDVAELLNVRPGTIYDMVEQRRIPYCKPNGSNILRFDRSEIIAWMKSGVKA